VPGTKRSLFVEAREDQENVLGLGYELAQLEQ